MKTKAPHQKSHVLVVDDHTENLYLIGTALDDTGEFLISFARNGQNALRIARKYLPDLILLDIAMLEMDGFEVCAALKDLDETRDIPIIFLTAERPEKADILKGFSLGGADYIIKPCSDAEIIARIKTHTKLKNIHDRLRKSESRYRAVVDDMTEMVCRFLPDTTLVFVNDAYCRYFKKSAEELLGTSFLEMTMPEDRGAALDHLKSLCLDHPILTSEHRVINGNSDIRWQQWTDRAIFDEAGTLVNIQSVGRDVTERVHAQDAYRNLVDHSFQGMAILQDQRCVFVNSKLAEITGHAVEALTAMTMEEILNLAHPKDQETIEKAIREISSGESAKQRLVTRFIRKDGKTRWLDVHLVRVSFWGQPSIQVAVMDITRIKELEAMLGENNGFGSLIGISKPMQNVYKRLKQLGPTNISVLITGETGTGKELAAEALHLESQRACGPLVRLNCAELPENLIESELFGHVKGAFTGADQDRIGRFQLADGGTLFLDEIGETPSHIQIKLLRAIEYQEIQRIGDVRSKHLDVRIIAATNADLDQEVQSGRFRRDLFFRLKGSHVHLPPLRERPSDIPMLLDYFIEQYCEQNKKIAYQIRSDVIPLLQSYAWPGNVRELKHAAESACAFCPDTMLSPEDFPPEIHKQTVTKSKTEPYLAQSSPDEPDEAVKIREALEKTRWHKSRTAQMLGMARSTLYRKISKYGLDESN